MPISDEHFAKIQHDAIPKLIQSKMLDAEQRRREKYALFQSAREAEQTARASWEASIRADGKGDPKKQIDLVNAVNALNTAKAEIDAVAAEVQYLGGDQAGVDLIKENWDLFGDEAALDAWLAQKEIENLEATIALQEEEVAKNKARLAELKE